LFPQLQNLLVIVWQDWDSGTVCWLFHPTTSRLAFAVRATCGATHGKITGDRLASSSGLPSVRIAAMRSDQIARMFGAMPQELSAYITANHGRDPGEVPAEFASPKAKLET